MERNSETITTAYNKRFDRYHRIRQAASPLYVSGGDSAGGQRCEKLTINVISEF